MKTLLTIFIFILSFQNSYAKSSLEEAMDFTANNQVNKSIVEVFSCAFSNANEKAQLNRAEIEEIRNKVNTQKKLLIINFHMQLNDDDTKFLTQNIIQSLNISQSTQSTCKEQINSAEKDGRTQDEIIATIHKAETLGVASVVESK